MSNFALIKSLTDGKAEIQDNELERGAAVISRLLCPIYYSLADA